MLTYKSIFQEHRLKLLGGNTLKKAVKLIVNYILTNEMQGKFNWSGKLGQKSKVTTAKIGIRSSPITPSIISKFIGFNSVYIFIRHSVPRYFNKAKYIFIYFLGALLTSKFFNTTESDIEKEIMIYLRNYADREGGRKRREVAKSQAVIEVTHNPEQD